ncbi:PE-PPE domain-containing protein [Mycobacterium deserti]|uniref:PE-PPE domain-containing protein n=1 Tax=Mycobacterium deserti TaxID=2978347 RepID=A0ABT2ME33_9MYCO|nr:PE-PPE domain-containing protein [Mycobacterium deserti]MCT7660513.1 PE-PPE domain-containing protein [Mycobacterium deserti]
MVRPGRKRGTRLAMGVAAVGVATSVVGVAATQPASISSPLVDLTALIAVGSSTNPSGAGVQDFFGGQFRDPQFTGPSGDDITTVNFLTGPWGIGQALQANSDDPRNAVVASGWGAANASLLLGQLAQRNDPVVGKTVWVLDNNVSAPDGGFGTRYPWFALIGVNPFPTPTDTGATVIVTAYQYNYNSNAPADLFNGLAHLNSLVAYLYGYQDQQQIDLPVDDQGNPTCGSSTCTVSEDGRVIAYVVQKGKTTYVTYTTDQLPLARLIRDVVPFGIGDMIADRAEPLLKLIVDSAYYGGNPIPADPSQYKPARLFPSPAEIADTISKIPGAVQEGFAPIPPAESTVDDAVVSTSADDQEQTIIESGEEPEKATKPLTNVQRQSDKSVPGKIGEDESETPDVAQDSTITQPETPTQNQDDADPAAADPGTAGDDPDNGDKGDNGDES